ncbi:MAG: 3-dehydroquinate synthase [Chitinophagales bacterium]
MNGSANIFYGINHLQAFLAQAAYTSVHVLVDENTVKHCYPKVLHYLPQHNILQIVSGEQHKTVESCNAVWAKLTAANADRKALLINLGGGVIGDLGGFSAACYKRSIAFINIPTTLLAMVDASVGGKTGIDFNGYKNQVGVFAEPEAVIIETAFLETLPERELHSGFAEVIKHYLIADAEAFHLLAKEKTPLSKLVTANLIQKNIAIKQSIVEQDPTEQGVRKALNFGHTIGHALESYLLEQPQPLLHGEAVAAGIIAEGYISFKKHLLKEDELSLIVAAIKEYYKLPLVAEQQFKQVLSLLQQDKKAKGAQNQFTLLNAIGNFSINNSVEESLIEDSLRYFNAVMQ